MTTAHTLCIVALISLCLYFSTRNCSSSKVKNILENSHKPRTFSFFQSYDGMTKTYIPKLYHMLVWTFFFIIFRYYNTYQDVVQHIFYLLQKLMWQSIEKTKTRTIARIYIVKMHQCALHWLQVVQKARERESLFTLKMPERGCHD